MRSAQWCLVVLLCCLVMHGQCSWKDQLTGALHPSLFDIADPGAQDSTDPAGTTTGSDKGDELSEAYGTAMHLVERARAAAGNLGMSDNAQTSLHAALDSFHSAEIHLKDWSTQKLQHGNRDDPGNSNLQRQSITELKEVIQQLQKLLPEEASQASAVPSKHGKHHRHGPSHSHTNVDLGVAPVAGPSPADDILQSVHCLEQLTAGLEAAAGGDGSEC
jgi:hypothetical protein